MEQKKIYNITFRSKLHPDLIFKSFPTDLDKYIESASNSKGNDMVIDNVKYISTLKLRYVTPNRK